MHDFASFIGLIGYYRNWIPYFEFQIRTTRQLVSNHDYTHKLTEEELPPVVYDKMIDLLDAVMSNPNLHRADFEKIDLRNDASTLVHDNSPSFTR